jgi:alpha-glucosidase
MTSAVCNRLLPKTPEFAGMFDTMKTQNFKPFSRLERASKTKTGVVANLVGVGASEQLRIELIADDVLRIKISKGGSFDEHPSFAVANEPKLGKVKFKVASSAGETSITTKQLVITLTHEPFALDVHRGDGTPVIESVRDEAGAWSYVSDGEGFMIRRKAGETDPIYGLGEKTGRFNRRGRDFTMWNTDVLNPTASGEFTGQYAQGDARADNTSTEFDPYYVSIPFFYHQDAREGDMSGSFIDNAYRGHYGFTSTDEIKIHFGGGQYTEYVFAGPMMWTILEQYTELTGRTALPPLWALGFHQCRWYAYKQADVEALAAKHAELDIPLDSLWLDIDYMDGYRVFTWNKELYPDAPAMLARLRELGVKVITIIDPGVKEDPGYEVYDDGLEKGVFALKENGEVYIGQVWPGDTAFPDFANEKARAWWGELNAEHVRSGLAGIWNDMNEPATGDKDPLPMRFDRGTYEHERFHNQYALLMAMGTVDGLLKVMPNLRTFVLSRAGSPGIQRYAANWMGDNMSRWDHLWLSIPMGNGLSVSGQSFVGADIGGFAEDTNAELYARWIQYGALTPFARVHSVINTIDQYVWSFGEQVLGIARESLKLRYRLLPYIYSSFVISSETGAPIQEPMIYNDQWDSNLWNIDDQYMFGPNLLVAPIYEPGKTSRSVYLPRGEWFDWHTGEHFVSEGRYIVAAAPLEKIPMFARAGAVIPMLAEAPQNTHKLAPKKLELHVFLPEAEGAYRSLLQEDDGLTFDSLKGGHLRTEFKLVRAGDRSLLEANTTGKGFGQFAREEFELVWHTARGNTSTTFENQGEGFSIFGTELAEGSGLVVVTHKQKKRRR